MQIIMALSSISFFLLVVFHTSHIWYCFKLLVFFLNFQFVHYLFYLFFFSLWRERQEGEWTTAKVPLHYNLALQIAHLPAGGYSKMCQWPFCVLTEKFEQIRKYLIDPLTATFYLTRCSGRSSLSHLPTAELCRLFCGQFLYGRSVPSVPCLSHQWGTIYILSCLCWSNLTIHLKSVVEFEVHPVPED